jgi:hypothetical protein
MSNATTRFFDSLPTSSTYSISEQICWLAARHDPETERFNIDILQTGRIIKISYFKDVGTIITATIDGYDGEELALFTNVIKKVDWEV